MTTDNNQTESAQPKHEDHVLDNALPEAKADPVARGLLANHGKIERNVTLLLVLSFITVAIGGIVEIAPLFYVDNTIEKVKGVRPWTPLELAGRNVYVREGCYTCHSQMIRPFRDEVERYGHYSLAAESMYDHPFQWGSKRTGPDLARVGGRYSDEWQVQHLVDPRSVVPESIMPTYAFLLDKELDTKNFGSHLEANRMAGVPYTDAQIEHAAADMKAQAETDGDSDGLMERYSPDGERVLARDFDGQPRRLTEMDALVAYLQTVGTLADLETFEPDTEGR